MKKQIGIKSVPVIFFLATAFAACSSESPIGSIEQPVAETLCGKLAECHFLQEGQTEQQCTDLQGQALKAVREVQKCVPYAEKMESFMRCMSQLSCGALGDDTNDGPPKDHPCYDQYTALSAADVGDHECEFLFDAPFVPGGSGAPCKTSDECQRVTCPGEPDSWLQECMRDRCGTVADLCEDVGSPT